MATAERPGLMLRIARDLRAYDAGRDALDGAAAAALGVSWSDVRAMRILSRYGGLSASDLARQLRLTTGAVTALIDRMERKAWFRRQSDPDDRRRTRIYLTAEGMRRERQLFGPLGAESAKWLSRRTTRDLAVIADFLASARSLLDDHRSKLGRQL